MKFLIIYGTRPEYIKFKPLLNKNIKSLFIKQHTDIIKFEKYDYSIDIEKSSKNRLNSIIQQIISKSEFIINQYDAVIVQGDTATTYATALVAYHLNKKIFYIESGLRTYDLKNPYPEEGYRQMISRIADINFCATTDSANNLKKEKVTGKIFVVGNTVLDNITNFKNKTTYKNKVLITLHRNENLNIIKDWLLIIDKFACEHKEIEFIFPAHPNKIIKDSSKCCKHIHVIEPLEHNSLIKLLSECKFVITDSGGIQEEAAFLNKKILVCRKKTERHEGIKSGHIILCKNPEELNKKLSLINKNYKINKKCPFGDGKSSEKIHKILINYDK